MLPKTLWFLAAVVGLCQQSAEARNPHLRSFMPRRSRSATTAQDAVPKINASHRFLARERLTDPPTSSPAPSLSASPSTTPSVTASDAPSQVPSPAPSSSAPTSSPSTVTPTLVPTSGPTTLAPTGVPSASPSSAAPTMSPAPTVSMEPTKAPTTQAPTTEAPTSQPSSAPISPTLQPSDAPTNSVVALSGFSIVVITSATDTDTDPVDVAQLTEALEEYLTVGMMVAYPNAVAVTLQQRTRRRLVSVRSASLNLRQLQDEQSNTIDYSGFIVFSGASPPVKDVQDLEAELMLDYDAVQAAVEANPALGQVRVEEVVFATAPDGNGDNDNDDDDDDNSIAIIGGIAGGSVVILAMVALLVTRRRTNPLGDDDDDDEVPPPPPPLPVSRDVVASDMQAPKETAAGATVASFIDLRTDSNDTQPKFQDSANRARQPQQQDYVLQPSSCNGPAKKVLDTRYSVPAVPVDERPEAVAASLMRTSSTTTTPNKTNTITTKVPAVAISPLTPARSVDSDDMDGYSLSSELKVKSYSTSTPVYAADKVSKPSILATASEDEEYNSDSESMFTYGNVGNDTSAIGIGASLLSYTLDDDEPPHVGSAKPRTGGATRTDNADEAAGDQPFDEANDDMEQDLDAFAAELERAKKEAQFPKPSGSSYKYPNSPGSSTKSNFAKNREAFEMASKAKAIGRAPVM